MSRSHLVKPGWSGVPGECIDAQFKTEPGDWADCCPWGSGRLCRQNPLPQSLRSERADTPVWSRKARRNARLYGRARIRCSRLFAEWSNRVPGIAGVTGLLRV